MVVSARVYLAANEYLDASEFLFESDKKYLWVSAVNAALSIEIYLKSCIPSGCRGHCLLDLFDEIPESFSDKLISLYDGDIRETLKKYDVFLSARYMYEDGSDNHIDSKILDFAHWLKDSIYELSCSSRHSPDLVLLEEVKKLQSKN
ncbi:hypothetical protein ACK24S_000185 [Vibrio fluvialis]